MYNKYDNWNCLKDLLNHCKVQSDPLIDYPEIIELFSEEDKYKSAYSIDLTNLDSVCRNDITLFLSEIYETGEIDELYSDKHNVKHTVIKYTHEYSGRNSIIRKTKFQLYSDQIILSLLRLFNEKFKRYTGMTYNSLYYMFVVHPKKFKLVKYDIVYYYQNNVEVVKAIVELVEVIVNNYYSASANGLG